MPALIAAEGIGLIRFEAGQPMLQTFIELIDGAKRPAAPDPNLALNENVR